MEIKDILAIIGTVAIWFVVTMALLGMTLVPLSLFLEQQWELYLQRRKDRKRRERAERNALKKLEN